MADRRPLALVTANQVGELPSGDTLAWAWLSGYPTLTTMAPLTGGADLSTNRTLNLDMMLLEEVSL